MGISLLKSSHNGGVVGYLVEGGLARVMNTAGAAIVLSATSLLTLMLAMDISLHRLGAVLSALGAHLPQIRKEKPLQAPPAEQKDPWLSRWRRFIEARAEAKRARAMAKLRSQRETRASIAEAAKASARISPGLAPDIPSAGEISLAKSGAGGVMAGAGAEYSQGAVITGGRDSVTLRSESARAAAGELVSTVYAGESRDRVQDRKSGSIRAEAREAVKA